MIFILCVTGAVLIADGPLGEARGAGRGCCPAVDEQRVPGHAELVRTEPEGLYHPPGLRQLARVRPASVSSLSSHVLHQLNDDDKELLRKTKDKFSTEQNLHLNLSNSFYL